MEKQKEEQLCDKIAGLLIKHKSAYDTHFEIVESVEVAESLINAGIGDVKQAQMELLLDLQKTLNKIGRRAYAYSKNEIIDEIRGKINEKVNDVWSE